jgi:hypothetical protein
MHRLRIVIFLAVCLAVLGLGGVASAAPVSSSAINDTLDLKLRAYLAGAKKNLGPLQSWQSRIFDDEAVPQYQRFIQDYRATSGGGIEAQVDYESLRQYLRFYAPNVLKDKSPTVVVVLFPQVDCPKCVEGMESVRALVRERLSTRGLIPEWASPMDLGITALGISNSDVVDTAARYADVKKASGSLVVRWGVAQSDEAAQEDETRYNVYTSLRIRGLASHDGSLELLEAEKFDRSVGKLMTDAFTDLGAKVAITENSPLDGQPRDESLIEIKGNWTYAQYSRLRDALAEGLANLGEMQEREVARGSAVFALYGSTPLTAISERVLAIPLDGYKLSVSTESSGAPAGRTLHLEAQPQ